MTPADADRSLGRGGRARILAAAATLFGRQGFNATSINELRAQARVSKRTLYQQFASKDEIVLAYLATSEHVGAVQAVLSREQLAPRSRLLEIFTTLADRPRPLVPEAFIAASIEFPDPEHPVHRAAIEYQRRFTEQLTELARAAGAQIPEQTGRQLSLLYCGAAVSTALGQPAQVANDAYAIAAACLRAAID